MWQGGRTVGTSGHVSKISGDLPDQAEFISTNNYMIITFSSDSETNGPGFEATWTTSMYDIADMGCREEWEGWGGIIMFGVKLYKPVLSNICQNMRHN